MIYVQSDQPEMQTEVILASSTSLSPTLYTMRLRYPRCIHGELMTHRVFSRNARSSRAVPVNTMLNEVRNNPFIPWHWGKNQKGMQASVECDTTVWVQDMVMPLNGFSYGHSDDWKDTEIEKTGVTREDAWLVACDRAIQSAEAFMEAGYHKQIVNRLLEPFAWIDTLVSTTDWDNFIWLRDHSDAEPHIRDLAALALDSLQNYRPQVIEPGDWHLPYVSEEDWYTAEEVALNHGISGLDVLKRISAARCARISYKPFDGESPDIEKDLELYDKLVGNSRVHASPLEHQATPDEQVTASIDLFYQGNNSLTPDETLDAQDVYKQKQLHGNLKGWIQFRKTVPGERYVGPSLV